jgi:anti-sigma factor RsiW
MFGKSRSTRNGSDPCGEAHAFLLAEPDGELTPAEEQALSAHLAACPACTQEAQAMRSFTRLLKEEPRPQATLPAGSAVAAQILASQARLGRPNPRVRFLLIPAAVALGAAVVFAPMLTRLDPRHEPVIAHKIPAETSVSQLPELLVLDDERSGRQVLIAPAVAADYQERGLTP